MLASPACIHHLAKGVVMRSLVRTLAVTLGLGLFAAAADAQYWPPPIPQAPDACGPGFYQPNCCGTYWGPIYCVRPPWEPFNGVRPDLSGGNGGNLRFPTHPYARSPRDYFMIGD